MKTIKQHLKIKATKGSRTIAKAGILFEYIDSDFKNYGCDVESADTKAIETQVFEIDKNGTFKDIFESISPNLDSLILTQSQIIEFCKIHKHELNKDGWGNFFLFKVKKEFFVAGVGDSDGDLRASVYRLSNDRIWLVERRSRVVAPQLITQLPGAFTLTLSPSESLNFENRINSLESDMENIKKFLII